MKITRLPKSPNVETRINFIEEINYHNKRCGKSMITPRFSKFMNYDILVNYFNDLKDSPENKCGSVLLCLPYQGRDSLYGRDVKEKLLPSLNEICGNGKLVEVNKREAVFEFDIIQKWLLDAPRKFKIHIEEPIYSIDKSTFEPKIVYARIVCGGEFV